MLGLGHNHYKLLISRCPLFKVERGSTVYTISVQAKPVLQHYLCLQEVEFGCGRVMSDVSSMFIVYLLELQTWYQDASITSVVIQDLWPHAKLAAEWHNEHQCY